MSASRSHGKTALVTGASTGIGAEFARQLARRGYDLLLVARRAEALAALAGELGAQCRVAAEAVPADLTDAADLDRVAALAGGAGGAVDLVVNNAGVGGGGQFARQDRARVERLLRLNVDAVTRLTHAALPAQLAQRAQHTRPLGVINVSSLAGELPAMPGGAVYAATKAFVRSFSTSLAVETARHGVHVTAVLPGYVRTEMTLGLQDKGMPDLFWVPRERVVREALRAFALGRAQVVPGLQYRLAGALLGVVPGGLVRAAMGGVLRRRG